MNIFKIILGILIIITTYSIIFATVDMHCFKSFKQAFIENLIQITIFLLIIGTSFGACYLIYSGIINL